MDSTMSINASHQISNCSCSTNTAKWDDAMNQLYTYFYLIIFIPGLLGNTLALWVLCRFISKKTKAIIFMINLAVADLAQVLSLPLRIHYYIQQDWPFGKELCLLCFYLKYLNMYASISFLVCISIQRCAFILHPFWTKKWRRRYDVCISIVVWVIVSISCSPFILMRKGNSENPKSCFKDLPMVKLGFYSAISMMVAGELLGFVGPLIIIGFCTYFIVSSLKKNYSCQQSTCDNKKALNMVGVCTGVFCFCFAPYHINFLLYLMVTQCFITNCEFTLAVKRFHPISLCMASLNCCLNPLIYYFLTTEFRKQISRQNISVLRGRLLSMERTSSYRE
ncbi:putative P2Y purinoceptor 10 [Triplophysa dalaica]|uniref:putative P2Y purinoceptor 10 n=1 Tax=Triplophysa dalaica TaxID=1582913 RepID=UPI0024DFBA8E|nr:putative P2Y purinoceptor 10 [Triplophysa dalaica]